MAFWDNFKKSLGGDRDAMQKIVDTLSPWNIAKRNVQENTKRILSGAKTVVRAAEPVVEAAQPVLRPVGQAVSFLGKGLAAPFERLSTPIGGGPGPAIVKAGTQIGLGRELGMLAAETGTDLNSVLRDGMVPGTVELTSQRVP